MIFTNNLPQILQYVLVTLHFVGLLVIDGWFLTSFPHSDEWILLGIFSIILTLVFVHVLFISKRGWLRYDVYFYKLDKEKRKLLKH